MDGHAPTDPRDNPYAQSKEFGERMLRLHCERAPELSATALRFPMLPLPWWAERLSDPHGVVRLNLNFGECLAYLRLEDAGELVARVVERRLLGYHQYFPARSYTLRNAKLSTVIAEAYADVELRRPATELSSLVDTSALEKELGWTPRGEIAVTLRD